MESTAAPTPVQSTPTVVTSELSDKDRQEQDMRQSLISKRQELFQIQQQRLKLELEQTKARLELQVNIFSSFFLLQLPLFVGNRIFCLKKCYNSLLDEEKDVTLNKSSSNIIHQ